MQVENFQLNEKVYSHGTEPKDLTKNANVLKIELDGVRISRDNSLR